MNRIRLLTFNIAHGRGLSFYQGFHSARSIEKTLAKITQVLRERQIDIVALQEVDTDSYWNKNINLLETIRQNTQYHYSFAGINNVRPEPRKLNYGNALLSTHPIKSVQSQPFSLESIGGKGFMFGEIIVNNVVIPLINIHLDFRSKARRVKQIDQVIAFLETRRCHLVDKGTDISQLAPIICGDFNCLSRRPGDAVQHLFQYLNEERAYQLVPEKHGTFPAYFPTRTLDFVFVPPRFKVIKYEVLKVYLSDHRPVFVEFELDDLELGETVMNNHD